MQAIITNGIQQIQQTVDAQPKTVTRQFRFLLFPEIYADQYYRIVFGRLLFWMMGFLLASYLYLLGKQGIESWKSVHEKNLEANHAKNAFDYLSSMQIKKAKRK